MSDQAQDPYAHITTEIQRLSLLRGDPGMHFLACRYIKMKSGELARPAELNVLQKRMLAAYLWLRGSGYQINLIVLKIRQCGGSTISAELCYHHGRHFNFGGFIMADVNEHTDLVWNMFCECAATDLLGNRWGNTFGSDTEKAFIQFQDAEGKKGKADWHRGTAGASTTGAAGTRRIAWFSESARYPREGAYEDTSVIANVLNSLPKNLPGTMRIAESTAEKGADGWHHDTFENAATLEQMVAGEFGNGWCRIFAGWHEFEECRLVNAGADRGYFNDEDDRWTAFKDDEDAGRIRYGWTVEQIAWRRKTIISDLKGNPQFFKRDFPSSPEEAWASSGKKRFNPVAVANMLKAAEAAWKATMLQQPGAPRIGSLQGGATGPVFIATREDAWIWVHQPPKFGCKHLIVIDPATGEQATGRETDAHAVLVIRDAWKDDRSGEVHRAEVVAAIHIPGGCRLDTDILAERIILLWNWYGRCMVVPEVNVSLDLLPPLRDAGVTLYTRPARPDDLNPSMKKRVAGFKTDKATKRLWVSEAAEAIREGTVGCLYLPAVKEMDTFVENPNGTCSAASGTHDVFVAAFGIGCLCLGGATMMGMPSTPSASPHGPRRTPNFQQAGAFG